MAETHHGRFADLLSEYALREDEATLVAAAELGRELVAARVPPEEIADLQQRALERLLATTPDLSPAAVAAAASVPLSELLMAYGLEYRRQIAREEEAAQRRRLEERMQRSQRLEALGTLAGGVAHDFNNILGAIHLFTELTLDDIPADGPAATNLEQVLAACHRARELVAQLLAFSRPAEQGEQPRPLRLTPLVNEALKLLRPGLAAGVELRFRAETADDTVLAVPGQIQQVVMNLVTNASQAMAATGGVLSVSIRETDNRLALEVEDAGPGIPAQDLPRVFDPFFTTKPVGEGNGLGLSVVHGVVTALGGEILLDSRPGAGCTFAVVLPRAPDSQVETAACNESVVHGHGEALLVDDNEAVAEAAGRLLSGFGYTVNVFSDPRQALVHAGRRLSAPALLLVDERMPGLSGSTLAAHLRRQWPGLPVILTSASFRHGDSVRLSDGSPLPILPKPFTRAELASALCRVQDPASIGDTTT